MTTFAIKEVTRCWTPSMKNVYLPPSPLCKVEGVFWLPAGVYLAFHLATVRWMRLKVSTEKKGEAYPKSETKYVGFTGIISLVCLSLWVCVKLWSNWPMKSDTTLSVAGVNNLVGGPNNNLFNGNDRVFIRGVWEREKQREMEGVFMSQCMVIISMRIDI